MISVSVCKSQYLLIQDNAKKYIFGLQRLENSIKTIVCTLYQLWIVRFKVWKYRIDLFYAHVSSYTCFFILNCHKYFSALLVYFE